MQGILPNVYHSKKKGSCLFHVKCHRKTDEREYHLFYIMVLLNNVENREASILKVLMKLGRLQNGNKRKLRYRSMRILFKFKLSVCVCKGKLYLANGLTCLRSSSSLHASDRPSSLFRLIVNLNYCWCYKVWTSSSIRAHWSQDTYPYMSLAFVAAGCFGRPQNMFL